MEIDIANKISNTPKQNNAITAIFIKTPILHLDAKQIGHFYLYIKITRSSKFNRLQFFNLVYFATFDCLESKLKLFCNQKIINNIIQLQKLGI